MTTPQPSQLPEEVTLNECPPGLFYFVGTLCFKSEYGRNNGQCDAYVVSSGEYFWGGASDPIVRGNHLVRPVPASIEAALTPYLAPRPPAPRDAELVRSDAATDHAIARWEKDGAHSICDDLVRLLVDERKLLNSRIIQLQAEGNQKSRELMEAMCHAPADSASAQLAAMREERDAARYDARHAHQTLEDLHAQLNEIGTPDSSSGAIQDRINSVANQLSRAKNGGQEWCRMANEALATLAAAQSEVGGLTKERDELRADAGRWRKFKLMPKDWAYAAIAETGLRYGKSLDEAIDSARAKRGEAR